MRQLVRFYRDESGSTSIEYVLIASTIAIFTLAALTLLSVAALGRFNSLATQVTSAGA